MATLNFNISKNNKHVTKEIVMLTKHTYANAVTYKYTYTLNGTEHDYTNDYISKKGDTYIGKLSNSVDVLLSYNEGIENVVYSPAYFTYVNNKGIECRYEGDVDYDPNTNSYTCSIETIQYVDEYITLIEE